MGLQPLLRWLVLATVMLLLLGACGGSRLLPVAQATAGPTPAALPTTLLPAAATVTFTPTSSARPTIRRTLAVALLQHELAQAELRMADAQRIAELAATVTDR